MNDLVVAIRLTGMAPGVPDIEGSPLCHDVIPAIKYLEKRGF